MEVKNYNVFFISEKKNPGKTKKENDPSFESVKQGSL